MPTYTDQQIQDKLSEFDLAIPAIVSRVDGVEPRVFRTADGADITNYGTVEAIAKSEADAAEVRANSYTDNDRLTLLSTAQTAAELAAQTKADLSETTAKAYADGIVTTAEAAAIQDATNKANAAQAAAILHSDNVLASLNLQDGIAGNQWYSFSTTPATNIGVLNDFALVDGRYTYKHNGTNWIYQSDLLGEQGVIGNPSISVILTSSNGNVFRNNIGSAKIITAKVFIGGVESENYDDHKYTWKANDQQIYVSSEGVFAGYEPGFQRYIADGTDNDDDLSINLRIIQITASDVEESLEFSCIISNI